MCDAVLELILCVCVMHARQANVDYAEQQSTSVCPAHSGLIAFFSAMLQ